MGMTFEKNLTLKEALNMVKQNPTQIRYMQDPPEDLCLAAVSRNGLVLEFIENQTPEICRAATLQNPEAKRFVKIMI